MRIIYSVWRSLNTRRLFVLLLMLGILTSAFQTTNDPDMWWHLATGRYISQNREIPSTDPFSYTASDHRWFPHEWLTDVGLYSLYILGGKPALILASAVTALLTFALVYQQTPVKPYTAGFITFLGALTSSVVWGVRPQLLNSLILAAFSLSVERFRKGKAKSLWILPILTMVWSNLHGGFLLGFAFLITITVGDTLSNLLNHRSERTLSLPCVRRLLVILIVCVLASLINPNTYHMLTYAFDTLGSSAMQNYIQEWASPNFHSYRFWPFAALLLGGAAVLILSKKDIEWSDVLLFFGLGFAGLVSARHEPLFAVIAPPIVARALDEESLRIRGRTNLTAANWVLLTVVFVLVFVRFQDIIELDRTQEAEQFPKEAVTYIRESGLIDQNIFNSYSWGGYLIWSGVPVFIDGRADVYGDEFLHQYIETYYPERTWQTLLKNHDVDYVLIPPQEAMSVVLSETPTWKELYRDDVASIFIPNQEPSDS